MNRWEQLRARRRKWVKKRGKRLLRGLADYMGRQSLIGDPPVFEPSPFEFTAELEANWRAIRTELESLLEVREHLPSFHEISPDQKKISKEDHWKTFIFYGFGYRADKNCARCPQTARLLDNVPNIQTAWFSILAPGYHIPAHRGVTKGVVRIHLGLMVPREREQCRMRVDDRLCYWEEGKCLVFDDTCEHEIWNDTDEQRAVLLLDVHRPMRLPGYLLSQGLIRGIRWTAYVQDARKNLAASESRFEAAVRRSDAYHVGPDS